MALKSPQGSGELPSMTCTSSLQQQQGCPSHRLSSWGAKHSKTHEHIVQIAKFAGDRTPQPCASDLQLAKPTMTLGLCHASAAAHLAALWRRMHHGQGAFKRGCNCTGAAGRESAGTPTHLQRWQWRRNSWPRPAPECAPSSSPGMSAHTADRKSTSTTPRLGTSVVKG